MSEIFHIFIHIVAEQVGMLVAQSRLQGPSVLLKTIVARSARHTSDMLQRIVNVGVCLVDNSVHEKIIRKMAVVETTEMLGPQFQLVSTPQRTHPISLKRMLRKAIDGGFQVLHIHNRDVVLIKIIGHCVLMLTCEREHV